MPNRDGTGPRGNGCGQGQGRRFGQGRGHGQGLRQRQHGKGMGRGMCKNVTPVLENGATLEAGQKLAVSACGPSVTDAVDARFGRAAYFLIFDAQGEFVDALDNQSSDAMAHGAGLAAVENLASAGVKLVLTGQVGPKATAALSAAGMALVANCEGQSAQDAVKAYMSQPMEA